MDRITILQKEAKVRPGKGKIHNLCSFRGKFAAAIEDRSQRLCQDDAMVDSLKMAVKTLPEQLEKSKQLLEQERNQNALLKDTLREELWKQSDSFGEVELKLTEKGIRQIHAQGGKEAAENPPHMYPLVKTECLYETDNDTCAQIVPKWLLKRLIKVYST